MKTKIAWAREVAGRTEVGAGPREHRSPTISTARVSIRPNEPRFIVHPDTTDLLPQLARVTVVGDWATNRSLPSSVKSRSKIPDTPDTEKAAPTLLEAKSCCGTRVHPDVHLRAAGFHPAAVKSDPGGW